VLVLVGAMMMGESTHIDWSSMVTAVPAFLTIVIQPFTFSIANGIYAGLVMSVLLWLLTGQFLETCAPGRFEKEDEFEECHCFEDDLERPILNGAAQEATEVVEQAAGVASPRHHLHHHRHQQLAIPIGGRATSGAGGRGAGSYTGSLVGSLGRGGARGTPYERGSFSMYINTMGSYTSPSARGLLRSPAGTQPCSEEPEHS
jgi:AGZA family xanthine/uracil permease-like MFS transporter